MTTAAADSFVLEAVTPCRDFLLRVQHAGFSLEGIVSKRNDLPYCSGHSPDWLKVKNPACTAVKPEEQED